MKEFIKTRVWPFVQRSLFLKSVIVISSAIASSPFLIDYYDSWNVFSALKYGQKTLPKKVYFTRNNLEQKVIKSISRGEKSGNYFLLVGEHGTGKTSLVQRIVQNSGGGMVYVSCPDNPLEFGQSFAAAINYTSIYEPSLFRKFFTKLSILPSSAGITLPMPEFEACRKKFFQAAERYKRETGHAPVLVIDDVNKFCKDEVGKKFLLQLQDLAKECAVSFYDDDLQLIFIYVVCAG